jgi:hypothetical protein
MSRKEFLSLNGLSTEVFGPNEQVVVINKDALRQGVSGVAFDFDHTITGSTGDYTPDENERVMVIRPQMIEIIKKLRQKGVRTVILSDSDKPYIIQFLNNSGYENLFSGSDIYSTQDGAYKDAADDMGYKTNKKDPTVIGCNILIDDCVQGADDAKFLQRGWCGIEVWDMEPGEEGYLLEALKSLSVL